MFKMAPKLIVFVEGNIGAGKTSALSLIQKKYPVYFEDIESWQFLDDFYANRERYSFHLQMGIMVSAHKQFKSALERDEEIVFMERSPSSGKVFVEANKASFSTKEHKLLEDMFDMMKIPTDIPTITIFIDTSVNLCYRRIKTRQRVCEADVSEDYLQTIQECYERYLSGKGISISCAEDTSVSEIATQIVEQAQSFALFLKNLFSKGTGSLQYTHSWANS